MCDPPHVFTIQSPVLVGTGRSSRRMELRDKEGSGQGYAELVQQCKVSGSCLSCSLMKNVTVLKAVDSR